MHVQGRPSRAAACNDNGVVAICSPAAKPRDVLTAAHSVCRQVDLLYIAQGSMLLTASRPQWRASVAA